MEIIPIANPWLLELGQGKVKKVVFEREQNSQFN
jgi:hypothetical protein